MNVRRATKVDIPAVAGAMARAFEDDPLFAWMMPDAKTRVRKSTALGKAYMRPFLKQDFVEMYTNDDRSGLAIWIGPETWEPPMRAMLPAVPAMLLGAGIKPLGRMAKAMATLGRVHPKDPHWYLAGLGTDPPAQGKGVGAALVNVMLERCDADRLPAYLETQKPVNVPYYEKFGFRVTGELDIPDGGPHMWLMWRDPQ
jgi:GNAT superfamily N-acetyltransferase